MEASETVHPVDRLGGPSREGLADPRLGRVPPRELARSLGSPPRGIGRSRTAKRTRLRIGPQAEGQGQRWLAGAPLRAGRGLRRRARLQEDEPHDHQSRHGGRRGGEGDNARPGRHAVTVAARDSFQAVIVVAVHAVRPLYSGK